MIPPRWSVRSSVIRLLASADFEASQEYLSQNDVVFDESTGGCTALYNAIQIIPDDFVSPGSTLSYIAVLQECNPRMVGVGNASDADKPLLCFIEDLHVNLIFQKNSLPETIVAKKSSSIDVTTK